MGVQVKLTEKVMTSKGPKKVKSEASEVFLRNLKSTKGLPRHEERMLIERAQKGDERASQLLVSENLGFIRYESNKWYHQYSKRAYLAYFEEEECDCFQIGVLAFIHAINKYDLSSSSKLTSYASLWIRQNIQCYFERKKSNRIVLSGDLTEIPPTRSPKRSTKRKSQNTDVTFAVNDVRLPEEALNSRYTAHALLFRSDLTLQERYVITNHLGIGDDPRPQREIAEELQLNRNTVARIYARGLAKMRASCEKYALT